MGNEISGNEERNFKYTIEFNGVPTPLVVVLHPTFDACFAGYCTCVRYCRLVEEVNAPEMLKTQYAERAERRGRWAWFERGDHGPHKIHLYVSTSGERAPSDSVLASTIAHELDHMSRGGFFTTEEAEASAELSAAQTENSIAIARDILTQMYVVPMLEELRGADDDASQDMHDSAALTQAICFVTTVMRASDSVETVKEYTARIRMLAVALVAACEKDENDTRGV